MTCIWSVICGQLWVSFSQLGIKPWYFHFVEGLKDLCGIIWNVISGVTACRQSTRLIKVNGTYVKTTATFYLFIYLKFFFFKAFYSQVLNHTIMSRKYISIFFSHHIIPGSIFKYTVRIAMCVLIHFSSKLVQQDLTSRSFLVPKVAILSVKHSQLLLMIQKLRKWKRFLTQTKRDGDYRWSVLPGHSTLANLYKHITIEVLSSHFAVDSALRELLKRQPRLCIFLLLFLSSLLLL